MGSAALHRVGMNSAPLPSCATDPGTTAQPALRTKAESSHTQLTPLPPCPLFQEEPGRSGAVTPAPTLPQTAPGRSLDLLLHHSQASLLPTSIGIVWCHPQQQQIPLQIPWDQGWELFPAAGTIPLQVAKEPRVMAPAGDTGGMHVAPWTSRGAD